MSRYHSYINSATTILSTYKGEEPFASFIKKYFAQNKKFGSKDRRQVSHLCYCYFRLGKALSNVTVEERLLIALYLCSDSSNEILQELKPEWNDDVSLSIGEKLKLIGHTFSSENIFPWQNKISESIDKNAFTVSHLQQPDLFLRLRPGKEKIGLQKLEAANIDFKIISETSIALSNASKIDNVIAIDKEVVIQDYNSQRAGDLLELKIKNQKSKIEVWDCCAASGGKSIMTKDILGDIDLTVSDVRESILTNLKKRFAEAGIRNYKSLVADLTKTIKELNEKKFDLILADVPCSGSGTWGRTPEQLSYFEEKKIDEYASLQKKIISTVIPHLADDGYLLYITCSVFKKENEGQNDFIKEKFHLNLIKMELLKGYDKKADTMFAALFQKKKLS